MKGNLMVGKHKKVKESLMVKQAQKSEGESDGGEAQKSE
jgi:hypothetical protein